VRPTDNTPYVHDEFDCYISCEEVYGDSPLAYNRAALDAAEDQHAHAKNA
jgi:hypothetical protein